MVLPLHKLERFDVGKLLIYVGLNVSLLNDLFLNGVLCNLPLSVLFIPNQPTAMEQPIEAISQFIGDQQPLVEGQPISLTWMFLQTVIGAGLWLASLGLAFNPIDHASCYLVRFPPDSNPRPGFSGWSAGVRVSMGAGHVMAYTAIGLR